MNAHRLNMSLPWRHIIGALIAAGWLVCASAETLINPTRPPAEWQAATQPAASPVPGAVIPETEAKQSMQMLVVGKSRSFAVIDGQIIKVGDTYNGASVLGIRRDGLVLQDEDGSRTLKLAPEVEKKTIAPAGKSGRKSGKSGMAAARASNKKALANGENK